MDLGNINQQAPAFNGPSMQGLQHMQGLQYTRPNLIPPQRISRPPATGFQGVRAMGGNLGLGGVPKKPAVTGTPTSGISTGTSITGSSQMKSSILKQAMGIDMSNPLHTGAAGALGGAALGGLGSLPFEEQRKKWLRNAMLGAMVGGGAGLSAPLLQQLLGSEQPTTSAMGSGAQLKQPGQPGWMGLGGSLAAEGGLEPAPNPDANLRPPGFGGTERGTENPNEIRFRGLGTGYDSAGDIHITDPGFLGFGGTERGTENPNEIRFRGLGTGYDSAGDTP